MPIDVFICHSASDSGAAKEVCSILEKDGFRCWIAPRDVPPGHEWAEAIVRGIDDSQIVLLVLSEQAAASRQVLREVERAVRAGKEIVTFRIEDVTPSGSLDYFLAVHQWIDAFRDPLPTYLATLPAQVGQLIRPPEQIAASPRSQSNVVELVVNYPGVRLLAMDIQAVVRLDGVIAKEGSMKHGFEFMFRTTTGAHELAATLPFRLRKRYPLTFTAPGRYRAELRYSRTWGNFSGRCQVFRDGSEPESVRAYFMSGNKALQSFATIAGFFAALIAVGSAVAIAILHLMKAW